jgi:glucose-1-phosphate cytidylyltransferase
MKVILLAGGLGSRLQEETVIKPKPMVEIGGRPILWHIMKSYDHFNFKEFIIALGYKGEVIKDYFINFNRLKNDLSIDLKTTQTTLHSNHNRTGRST